MLPGVSTPEHNINDGNNNNSGHFYSAISTIM